MILNDELMKTRKRQSSYKYTFIKVKMESGQSIKKNGKKICEKLQTLCELKGGSAKFDVCTSKKWLVFSYLELKKNGRFWSVIGLISMDLSLGRKGT